VDVEAKKSEISYPTGCAIQYSMLPGSFLVRGSVPTARGGGGRGKLKGARCKRAISLYSTVLLYCTVLYGFICRARRGGQQGVEESRGVCPIVGEG